MGDIGSFRVRVHSYRGGSVLRRIDSSLMQSFSELGVWWCQCWSSCLFFSPLFQSSMRCLKAWLLVSWRIWPLRIGNIEKHFSLICCQVLSSKSKAAYFEVSFSVHLQILLNTILVFFFLKSWYILVVLPELHNLK